MEALSIPKKVNGTVVRLVAGQVFFLSLLFIFTGQPAAAGILVLDFLVRSLGYPQFSLLALTGRGLAGAVHLKSRPIFFKPKRFAASIGLGLSLLSLVFLSIGLGAAAAGVIGLLGIFSFLEAFFGFCGGCKIYGYLIWRGWISDKNCPDCVY